MDWLSEIGKFPPLDINESGLNISAKEASQAIAKYDKALKNAQNDSLDISIIELRKLVVLYPEMGQAAILLGCCQMQENKPIDSLKNFRKASLANLPIEFSSSLDAYIEEAQNAIEIQLTNPDYKIGKTRYPIESKPEIIVASPGKWKNKIKVASKREKREIMRSQSSPQVKETFVSERMDINWVKVGITTISILLVLGIGILLYIFIPKAVDSIRNSGGKNETKLEWLLAHLNEKTTTNPDIDKILKDYDGQFYPTAGASQEANSQSGSVSAVSTVTPTIAPTSSEKIVLAAHSVEQAKQIGKSDPKQVMLLITKATTALAGIVEKATAPELAINAGEIMTEISQLMKNIVNAACFPFYRDGKVKMQARNYADAIILFQKAYDINPDYIDGGNAYNLGKAYSAAGQITNANKYFQYVIDHFPGTDVAGWASGRIKPTGEIKE